MRGRLPPHPKLETGRGAPRYRAHDAQSRPRPASFARHCPPRGLPRACLSWRQRGRRRSGMEQGAAFTGSSDRRGGTES